MHKIRHNIDFNIANIHGICIYKLKTCILYAYIYIYMHNTCSKYANMQIIWKKYAKNMLNMQKKNTINMQNICRICISLCNGIFCIYMHSPLC